MPNLLATLDAIREVDVSDTSGFGWWDRNGNGQDETWRDALLAVGGDRPSLRIHGWSERINDTPAAAAALRDGYRTLRRLAEHQPEARHLVHGDLLNRNVLTRDGSVSAVLDWGSSQYGDFLLDIAWLWVFAPWSDGCAEIDFRLEAERHYREVSFPVPALEDRLRACSLYVAIDALAYLAWKGDRHELDATAERTVHILNA